MAVTISKTQLKARMLQIFRELEESGEELIVTDRDRPVLRVVPFRPRTTVEDVFADIYGQIEFFEDPNAPTSDDWLDLL
ncbi:MAG: hypothetical protein KJZ86_27840 [Caldilineaceae bacterium]|nr:hypothetical protein [Caldilineaceae bacterium]HRJ44013.1 hypothetical protein [Caldilineaceae bacterium]